MTQIGMASPKGSASAHSSAKFARLMAVGFCLRLCQKGLSVTFEEVENLVFDMPVVLLTPTL